MSGHFREQNRGNRARLKRLGENHEIGGGKKQSGNFIHSFVAHRAIHQENAAAREILLPEFEQFFRAGGIVRAVEIHGRAFAEPLETPGPAHRANSALDSVVHDRESSFGQEPRSGSGGEGVANLKAARERRLKHDLRSRISRCRNRAVTSACYFRLLEFPCRVHLHEPRADITASLRDHRTRFRPLRGTHNPGARLDDSSFFARDFRNGVAEKTFVIEINRRNDRDLRLHDVG